MANGFGQAQARIGEVRISQAPVEVLILPTDANIRVSQTPIEVVILPTDANIRFSQLVVEVLIQGLNLKYGQAQADIKAVSYTSGQSNADIKATSISVAQAQSDIKVFTFRVAQAQSDIKATSYSFGQAQASLLGAAGYGQATAYIIFYAITIKFQDTFTRTTSAPPFAIGNADTGTAWHWTDWDTTWTEATTPIYVDGSELVLPIPAGQGYDSLYNNAATMDDGEFFIDIWIPAAGDNGAATYWWDTNWYIGVFSSTDTQVYLRGNDFAPISITISTRSTWYSLHAIVSSTDSNHVKARFWETGTTEPSTWNVIQTTWPVNNQLGTFYNPQAPIFDIYYTNASEPSKFDNIKVIASAAVYINSGVGQANSLIYRSERYGQAQAEIKAFDTAAVGQTQALIIKLAGYGQAQGFIRKAAGFGQAQAYINKRIRAFGQAQVRIDPQPALYADKVIRNGASAYWKLNESSGTTAKDYVGSLNGTYTGSLTLNASGPALIPGSSAVTFDDSDSDYVDTPTPTGLPSGNSDRTVEAWFTNSGSNADVIFGYGNPGFHQQFVLALHYNNDIAVSAYSDDPSFAASSVNDGNWHYIAVTYTGSTRVLEVWLDGSSVGTYTFGSNLGTTLGGSDLGRLYYANGFAFNGKLAHVAIYPKALDQWAIADHALGGISPVAYGQASVYIKLKPGWGQAQAIINQFTIGYGQAQARLIAFNVNRFAQAQADILTPNINKYANANALIQQPDGLVAAVYGTSAYALTPLVGYYNEQGPAEPNYGNYRTGQITPALFSGANGSIVLSGTFVADQTGTWQFRIDVDDGADLYISDTRVVDAGWGSRFAGEGTFTGSISLTAGNLYTIHVRFGQGGGPYSFVAYYQRPTDSQYWLLTDNGPPWIRRPILQRFAQAQARIVATDVNRYGQALAFIGHLQYAQAQAKIKGIVQASGNANAYILNGIAFGQAQADIKAVSRSYGQTAAAIGHQTYSQAQVYVSPAFNQPTFGQTQADIVNTDRKFGLALAAISHGGTGLALADIVKTARTHGLTSWYIRPRVGIGNANARIKGINVNGYGQATVDIHTIYYVQGQAVANILKSQGLGLTLAQIKQHGRNVGQARVSIGHFQYGSAQVYISKSKSSGQTQAEIKQKYITYGQAQTQIIRHEGYGLALADIDKTYQVWGQTQVLLNMGFGLGQTQADILQAYTGLSNSQARILRKQFLVFQAQAMISVRYYPTAQAQAKIISVSRGYGQTQTQVGGFRYAQAQAKVITYNVPRNGQAMGYIVWSSPSVTPPYPTSGAFTYLVRYDGFTVPGYAQKESYDSIIDITTHAAAYFDMTLKEYGGLTNKIISLDMRLWEQTYAECKARLRDAATLLRRNKGGFAKLYIQSPDRYYLAMPQKITVTKDVNQSMRILDYGIQFEAKPWVYSEAIYEVSSASSPTILETTGRQLSDGIWTPTKVLVSGADVVITGVDSNGENTGSIHLHGSVSNFLIDTENLVSTSNNIVINKDYGLWVGIGNTVFTMSGVTDIVIQYQNRWIFGGSYKVISQQALATSPIEGIVIPPPVFTIDGLRFGQAGAFIFSPVQQTFGLGNAYIFNPVQWVYGQTRAVVESPIKNMFGQAQGVVYLSLRQRFAQSRVVVQSPIKDKFAQALAFIHATKQLRFGQTQTQVQVPVQPTTGLWFGVPQALTNSIPANAKVFTSGSLTSALTGLNSGEWLVLNWNGTHVENVSVALKDNVTIISASGKRPWLDGSLHITAGNNIRILGLSETWTNADPSGHMFKHDGGTGEVAYGEYAYAACYTLVRPGQAIHDTRYHHLWVHDNFGVSSHDGNQDHGFYCSAENPSQNVTIDHCLIENNTRGRNIKIGGPSLGNPIGGITVSKTTLKLGYGPSNAQVSNGATGIIFDRLVLIDSGDVTNLTVGTGAGTNSVYTNCWSDETTGPNNSNLRDGGGNLVKSRSTLLDYTANGAAGKGHLAS